MVKNKTIDVEELKQIQLAILEHVDGFCRKHNIQYFLCYGTCLGAVRHKGYIPWDDDIDIAMLRDDYERFVNCYGQKDKSSFYLHSHKINPDYPYPFAKIDDTRTIVEEEYECQWELGVNIDLFPIDVVPEGEKRQKLLYRRTRLLMNILFLKQLSLENRRCILKNVILLFSHILLKPISIKTIVSHMEDNATKYRNTSSRFCGIAVWGYGTKEINLRSNWDVVKSVPFENLLVPVPIGYDNYLRSVYGEYMQLPPEEKRISHHHFKAYWK